VCRGTHNHAQDEEAGSDNGNPASSHDVGDGPNKRTDGGEREEVGEHKPNPSVNAANIAVDLGRDATEEVHWDLTAGPYYAVLVKSQKKRKKPTESHGNESHDPLEVHRDIFVVFAIASGPQAVFLIVVVARHDFVRMNLLDVVEGRL
jgi:hypothetical protein